MTQSDGLDRLGDRSFDYFDRKAGSVADHPKRWIFGGLAVLLVLIIVGSVIGWAAPWAAEAKKVTGPANVSAQYQAVISDWQSLISEADNVCTAQDATAGTNDPVFVEDPAAAYKASYRNTRIDYNTRQQDIFEAKLVGPGGYPRTVPVFPETSDPKASWCNVSTELQQIHS